MDLPDDVWDRLGMEPPDPLHKRWLRRTIYARDGYRCRDCGAVMTVPDGWRGDVIEGFSLGHVIPHSWGGTLAQDNLICQCKPCNEELADEVWTGPRYPDGRPT